MGILYARIDGAWVPIGNGSVPYDPSPAQAGPRSAPWQAMARFGHVSGSQGNGFIMTPGGAAEVNIATGQAFNVYNDSSALIASLVAGNSTINTIGMGVHPNHGLNGIWTAGDIHSAAYWLLRSGNTTILNGFSTVELRVGNAIKVAVDSNVVINPGGTVTIHPNISCNSIGMGPLTCTTINTNGNTVWCGSLRPSDISCTSINANGYGVDGGRFYSNYQFFCGKGDSPTGWDQAQHVASAGGSHALISLNSPGYACQIRNSSWGGAALEVVNLNNSAYMDIWANAFVGQSALAIKRDVRSLRPERERIVVRHDPFSDTVPEPDIMALRPVVFRPKTPNLKMVPAPGYDEMDPQDSDSWITVEEPLDSVFGRQGTRERLGLIADEVQHVIPSAVYYNGADEVYGIEYSQITVALLDHVQRLTDEVATLRYRIAELENAS